MLRCTLSDYDALVTVSANQPAYKNYTNYLPAYMMAYVTQKKTSVIAPYHQLAYENTKPFVTTSFPSVSVSFNGVPVSETLDAIRNAGGKEMKSKGQLIFLIPSPSSAILRVVSNGGALKTTPAITGSVNLASLSTLSLIRRTISNFLFTHQYPAFIDADHLKYTMEHWPIEVDNGLKRKRLADDVVGPAGKKRAVDVGEGTSSAVEADVLMEPAMEELPPSETIIYAMPPPVIRHGWGTVDQLPAGDGLFVRYISETQNGKGEKAVTALLIRYFLGCLGTNAEGVRSMVKRIREDWGVIAETDAGKELAHICKCIDLGITAQARVFPIIDEGQYLGCALMGAGFQISAYNTVYTPTDNQTLKDRIGAATSHKAALQTIADIASGGDPDVDVYDQVKGCVSMIELRNLLISTELTTQQREQVCASARGLRFRNKPFHISSDNLSLILSAISNPNQELDTSLPIHPQYIFEGNRSHLLWSVFGDLAPTFNFPGGPQIDLTRSKDLPTHVAVRNIALSDALIDLDVVIRDKKYSGASNNRRSGPFKDRIYTKHEARQILTNLCSAVGVVESATNKGKDKVIEAAGGDLLDEGF